MKGTFSYIILFLLAVTCHCKRAQNTHSIELEENLTSELFANYSAQQRPKQKVKLSVRLTILTINELNIKQQTLSLSGYLTLSWIDDRLSWDDPRLTSQNYSGINFLFATEKQIWKPTIIIENAVDGLSAISDGKIPMRVTQSGRVVWNPVGIYKVSCKSDTRYYPMDTQTCYFKVTAWAYTSHELELNFRPGAVDNNFYTENGEWDLLSATSNETKERVIDGDGFSSLSFKLRLQRRQLFHIINTLFPVAVMAILIAFVFKLSVESGEKIGFSLTVLLSYAVYLTLISDNIPSTSTTICYLTLYLAFILLLSAVAVCCSTFVINLHMRNDENEIQPWIKKLTNRYLKRIACWEQGCTYRKIRVSDPSDCSSSSSPEPLSGNVLFVTEKDTKLEMHLGNEEGCTNRKRKSSSDSSICPKAIPEIGLLARKRRDVNSSISEKSLEKHEDTSLTWRQLAEIMDRVFYNVYIFLILLSTIILFLIISFGFAKAGE